MIPYNNYHCNQKKRKLNEPKSYTHFTSASASTWSTPCPSLAYINRFGLVHIHDLLFFSSLCFGCVPSQLSCQSSMCNIYNYVMVHHTCTHAFLSWTTSTYHIYSYPIALVIIVASTRSIISSLSLARTCIIHIIPCTVRSYTFSRTILYYSTHACFLEQLYITIYILRFELAIQAGFVIANAWMKDLEYYKLREWFSATRQSI